MKKSTLYAKKTLSVFMAVMMLLSAWVFVPGEHNHASAVSSSAVSSTNLSAVNKFSDANFDTGFTTVSGNFHGDNASTMASRGYYKNVLYSPHFPASNNNLTDTYAGVYFGNLGGTADGARVWYPETTIILDGSTTPQIPILFDIDSNNNNRVGVKNVYISSGANGLVFKDSYWTAKSECGKDTNYYTHFTFDWIMQNNSGNYWISTSSGNDKESMCSTKGYWDIYGTYLQYTGGSFGSGSTYYKAITPTWVCRTGSNYTGTTNKTIYVIDYVPLKNALNNVKTLISEVKKNPAKYTTASVSALASAADKLIAAKPNNYINSSSNQVVNWNSAVSSALSAYDSAKNLVVQQYTLTFEKIDGTVVKEDSYDYGTTVDLKAITGSLANSVAQIEGNATQHQTYTWNTVNNTINITSDITVREVASSKADHTFPNDFTQGADVHTKTCSVCGYDWSQAHNSNTVTTTKEATCSAAGEETYSCSICGKVMSTKTIDKLPHTFSGEYTIKDGKHYKICSGCGESYDGETHIEDNGTVTTKPGCLTPGENTYKCVTCGTVTRTETVQATGHKNVTKTDAKVVKDVCGGHGYKAFWTCADCGKIYTDEALTAEIVKYEYTTVGDVKVPTELVEYGPDHSFTSRIYQNVADGANGSHMQKCVRCDVYGAEEAHDFTSEETPSTCTFAGNIKYTCSKCTHSYKVDLELAAHTMKKHAAVAAECEKDGSIEYYSCSVCEKNYDNENGTNVVTNTVISALGHTIGKAEDQQQPERDRQISAATCISPAVYAVTCDRCDLEAAKATYTYGEAAPHNYNGQPKDNGNGTHSLACTNEWNCGTYGEAIDCAYETYAKYNDDNHKLVCACGAYTTEAHTWSKWVADSTGVGSAAGTMTKTCADCGQTKTTNCSYTELRRKEATCDNTGLITYKCTDADCGHIYTEVIPQGEHKWVADNETYVKTPATCEANAVYYEYCTNCQKSSENYTGKTWTKSNSKLTHNWSDWTQTVDADGVASHTRTCSHASSASCTETAVCSGGKANCVDKAKCAVCGNAYGKTDAANHKTVETIDKVEPTCQLKGETAYKHCSACNTNVTEPEDIDTIAHVWGAWSKDEGADTHTRSCTNCVDTDKLDIATETVDCAGGEAYCNEKATCSTCNKAYGKLAPLNHKTEAWHYGENKKEETCQEAGNTGDKIYDCCDALMEAGVAIEMKAHDFSLEESRTPATCIEEGSVVYKCATCVETEDVKAATNTVTLAIDPKNHASEEIKIVGKVDATCETDGNTGSKYHACCYVEGANDATNKNALIEKGTVIKANGQHKFEIIVPEYMLDTEALASEEDSLNLKAEEPDYDGKVAARHEDGNWYHAKKCSICKEVVYEACYTYEHTYSCERTDICYECGGLCSLKDPKKHVLEEVEGKAATATEKGTKNYYKCEDCDKCFLDAAGTKEFDPSTEEGKALIEIPVISASCNWDTKYTVTQEPTCVDKGYKEYKCTDEGCDKVKVVEIPATGKHTWSSEYTVTQEPTCGKNGYKAIKCTVCDAIKSGSYQTVPATGEHTYDLINTTPGTSCTDPSIETYKCRVCGDTYDIASTTGVSAHTWSEWITKGGDCSTGVVQIRTCSSCQTQEQRIETTVDHNLIIKVKVEATCETDGYIDRVCKNCGFTPEREIIPATSNETGHVLNTDLYKTIEKATCETAELRQYTCTLCGEQVVQYYGAPLDHVWLLQAAEIATCERDGHSEYYRCVRCEAKDELYVKYPATGHADNDGNGKCDSCNGMFYEGGNEPCDCMCHNGNWFMRIIYKIFNFFWKLFKTNPSCACGNTHY